MSNEALLHARIYSLGFAATVYLLAWFVLQHGTMLSPHLASFPRWPVLFDFLLTAPAVTWWLHRQDRHRAWRSALSVAALGILLAIWLLPNLSAAGTRDLRSLRTIVLLFGAMIELALLARLWRFFTTSAQGGNPEYALQQLVEQRFGTHRLGRVIGFELRMWLHALMSRRRPWRYTGERHFSYHAKDGYAANLQGWPVLLMFSLPAQHVLLHLFSPALAWVADAATLYVVFFLLAHYRACQRCPVSLDGQNLYLRHGLNMCEQVIEPDSIIAIHTCNEVAGRRVPGVLNLAGTGRANVRIRLRERQMIERFYGMQKPIDTIYLGLDSAPSFFEALGVYRPSLCASK